MFKPNLLTTVYLPISFMRPVTSCLNQRGWETMFSQSEKSCESWFSNSMSVCGFWIFNVVPGIIIFPSVTFYSNAQSIMLSLRRHLIFFHVPWFTYCLYRCWCLSDGNHLQGQICDSWLLKPCLWCKSKGKKQINFLVVAPTRWMMHTNKQLMCLSTIFLHRFCWLQSWTFELPMVNRHNPV